MNGVYWLYVVFAIYLVDTFAFMALIFTLDPSMAPVLHYYWVPQILFPLLWLGALKKAAKVKDAHRSKLYVHSTKYFLVLLLLVVLVRILYEPTEIDEQIRTSSMMLILSISAALSASLVVSSQTRVQRPQKPRPPKKKKKR